MWLSTLWGCIPWASAVGMGVTARQEEFATRAQGHCNHSRREARTMVLFATILSVVLSDARAEATFFQCSLGKLSLGVIVAVKRA